MTKPVLFVTGLGKELKRAENMNCLYEAYDGEKKFISSHDWNYNWEVASGKYDLMVIDVFPTISTGKTIMIWHAIQGGKYIGLNDPNTYYSKNLAPLMDHIVVAGYGGIDMFHECTNVPKEKIVNLGMPRTDRYIGKKKGDGMTMFAYKKTYLYAPTHREEGETPMPEIDWKWLDGQLRNNEVILVKSHPFTKTLNLGGYKHIMEVSGMESSVKYLYDSDVVITDYSSIMFDAYLLNKPVVLFEKKRGYTETRGMYMNYPDQYCSRFATDEKELLELIRGADQLTETERECADYVADACDGHSCERICKLIHEMNTQ